MDTNTIIECHRTGTWTGLAGAWPLETVEACIIETQTAKHKRPLDQQIDEAELRKSFAQINQPSPLQLANTVFLGGPFLDEGERHLWAHALVRQGAIWMLCGPDKASMRFGVKHGLADRLRSTESLLKEAGVRPKIALRRNHEEAWLRGVIGEATVEFVLGNRK